MKVLENCLVKSVCRQGSAVVMTMEAGDMVRTQFRRPGQFIHIKCADDLLLRRPLAVSACFVGEMTDFVTIAFEVKGAGTRWLAERRPGDLLDVLGFAGNGFDMEPGGRYLLAGGGIGAAPLLGCAQFSAGRCTAALGFQNADSTVLLTEFESSCNEVLVATDDGSLGFGGFTDALVRSVLEEDRDYDGVLTCGPRVMMRAVAAVAEEFDIPCQVSMEARMGCGVGACLVCTCDMADGTRKRVCRDGPVFDAREVDWGV